MKWLPNTYCCIAHAHTVDAYAGRRVHNSTDSQLRLDGGIKYCFLLLQVEYQAQFWQRKARGPSQTKQHVVEIDSIAAQPPVMGRTWERRGYITSPEPAVVLSNTAALSAVVWKSTSMLRFFQRVHARI